MIRGTLAPVFLLAALAASAHGQGRQPLPLRVTSSAFAEGQPIPSKYTCDGKDVSPPLHWENTPSSARTCAVICDDPDAPGGTWVHWVIFDVSADTQSLPEGVKKSSPMKNNWFQGLNDFDKVGYNGPCPPAGMPHRYFFKVYALDEGFSPPRALNCKKSDLARAIEGHIVAEGSLMGTYQRK